MYMTLGLLCYVLIYVNKLDVLITDLREYVIFNTLAVKNLAPGPMLTFLVALLQLTLCILL